MYIFFFLLKHTLVYTDVQHVDPRRRRSSGARGPVPRSTAPTVIRDPSARNTSGDAIHVKILKDPPTLTRTPSFEATKVVTAVDPVEVRDPRRRNQVDDPRIKEHR